jgi:hypothetical protein
LNVEDNIFDPESTIGSLDSDGVRSDEDEPEPDTEVELYKREDEISPLSVVEFEGDEFTWYRGTPIRSAL